MGFESIRKLRWSTKVTEWADGDKRFEDEGGAGVQHLQTKG